MSIEDEIKSKFRNDYHKALVNLYYTNNVIGEQFFKMLKNYGLAAPQFNVLRILKGQHPQAASIGLIKERMLDKNSDASRIVDRLYKKKLVERKESKADRRQKDILITKKGLELLNKMVVCEKQEDDILSNLNIDEVKLLNGLLDKIRDK
ncbi:MarR family winged helix-turn-helix transcriptional regulator [Marinoscillum luteum]|jgi:MarR family transcriptional regulator, multiple gene regulator MgrA|uniref:MarR family winged helix-turn-helix transcriptional regulator n=1 Tax=Marinoscillum luteum TaxID=861051 RepID=A0ABW7N7B5_9BACT